MKRLTTGKILKLMRVVTQLAVLIIVTCCLTAAPTMAIMASRQWIEHWMIMPMTVLGSLTTLGFWLAITLFFGRLYCSWVCPIGTLQDVGEWLFHLFRHRRVYRYCPPNPPYVRVALWCLFILAAIFGSMAVSWTLLPFLQLSPVDSYSYITSTIEWLAGGNTPFVARIAVSASINLVFLLLMGVLKGRTVCNTLCPTGGCLGTVNHFSILQFNIDTDKCTHCFKCEYVCKANCINSLQGTVDAGRCVSCFNCVAVCPDDSIRYTTRRHRLQLPLMMTVKKTSTSVNIQSSSASVSEFDSVNERTLLKVNTL